MIIVLSDGQSGDKTEAARQIIDLRAKDAVVIGVGIESTDAIALYSPDGRLVTDITQLPSILLEIVEEQITRGVMINPVTAENY